MTLIIQALFRNAVSMMGWMGVSTLVVILLMVSSYISGSYGQQQSFLKGLNLTAENVADVEEKIKLYDDSILEHPRKEYCLKDLMERYLGDPIYVSPPKGIYFTIIQAYHAMLPAVQAWQEVRSHHRSIRRAITAVRGVQEDQFRLERFRRDCNQYLKQVKDMTIPVDDRKTIANKLKGQACLQFPLATEHYLKEFHKQLYRSCLNTLWITVLTLYFSVNEVSYNYAIRRWEYSPFYKMRDDVNDIDSSVQKLLEEFDDNRSKYNQVADQIDKIKERLRNPPYDKLFLNGSREDEDPAATLYVVIEEFTKKNIPDPNGDMSVGDYLGGWDTNDLAEFHDNFEDYFVEWEKALRENVYDKHLKVERIEDTAEQTAAEAMWDKDGNLVNDGLWQWDYEGNNTVQNMRMAWDLMDAVHEELKCYMKKSYYFHLRPQALQDTQLDLTKGALYMDISQTLGKPCRIEPSKDYDLVTKYCTRKNHEICAPIGPLKEGQRTDSDFHGGIALLRPKWVYRYDQVKGKCVGRRDYILNTYVCTCGFRMDCGKDLGEDITCQLYENDLLRNQCRGSVGYPCKTLPLAPGKYNETCGSGYCDMKKNSCEDKPYENRYSRPNGVASIHWHKGRLSKLALLRMMMMMTFLVVAVGLDLLV